MAVIYKRLSTKVQAYTNLSEVLISLKNGNDYFVRAKSGVFVTPDNFRNGEIVVNRRKVGNNGAARLLCKRMADGTVIRREHVSLPYKIAKYIYDQRQEDVVYSREGAGVGRQF